MRLEYNVLVEFVLVVVSLVESISPSFPHIRKTTRQYAGKTRSHRMSAAGVITELQHEYTGKYYPPISPRDLVFDISEISSLLHPTECLVIVDNFLNSEIYSSHTSAIIRRQQLQLIREVDTNLDYRIWTAFGPKPPTNMSSTYIQSCKNKCPLSKYFAGLLINQTTSNDYCVRLNYFMFASNAKPWHCLIQISLQIQSESLSAMKQPLVFYFEVMKHEYGRTIRIEQSVIPLLLMFVQNELVPLSEDSQMDFALSQFQQNDDKRKLEYSLDPKLQVKTVEIITQNNHWQDFKRFCLTSVSKHSTEIVFGWYCVDAVTIKYILRSTPREEDNVRWELFIYSFYFKGTIFKFAENVAQCRNLNVNYPKTTGSREHIVTSPVDIFASGISAMLCFVISNGTVVYLRQYRENPTDISFSYTSGEAETDLMLFGYLGGNEISQINSLTHKENLYNLAFVSCGGNKGKDSLGLSDLPSSYRSDAWVWIVLMIAGLILANRKLSATITPRRGHFTHLLHLTKVLLEQGDPFPASYCRHPHLRLTIGTTLLVAIVLSNGYKSSSIENVISPKQLLPYTNFTELVNGGFSVFVRPAYVNLKYPHWNNSRERAKTFIQYSHFVETLETLFFAASEINEWVRFLGHNHTSYLEDHTEMHPNSSRVFSQTIKTHLEGWRAMNYRSFDLRKAEIDKVLLEPQEALIYEHMDSCKKTSATLVPAYQARKYAAKIFRAHPEYRLNVGSDLFNGPLRFFL